MLYETIKKNSEFNNVSTANLSTPSAAVCYIGYDNAVSGRPALILKSGYSSISQQTICNTSYVKDTTLTASTNLNYQLGDIFYVASVTAGSYTVTVSNLDGTQLKGRSILLYLNNVPANTIIEFGGTPVLNTSTGTDYPAGSYCLTFTNLTGNNVITCTSVWRTPGAQYTVTA